MDVLTVPLSRSKIVVKTSFIDRTPSYLLFPAPRPCFNGVYIPKSSLMKVGSPRSTRMFDGAVGDGCDFQFQPSILLRSSDQKLSMVSYSSQSTTSRPTEEYTPSPNSTIARITLPLPFYRRSSFNQTTIMVSGLPNKYTQDVMLDEIQSRDLPVDFFYMPLFPSSTRNVGYCFVNLSTVDGARRFCEVFDGLHLTKTHACIVSLGRIQGKEANIVAYQGSIAATVAGSVRHNRNYLGHIF